MPRDSEWSFKMAEGVSIRKIVTEDLMDFTRIRESLMRFRWPRFR